MNSMKNFFVCVVAFLFAACLFYGCKPKEETSVEENLEIIKSFINEDDFVPLNSESGAVFFADCSSVLIDAMDNSPVYDAMKGQISQYVMDLVFIEGERFDSVKCNRSDQAIFNALSKRAKAGESKNADILKSIENICNGDREGLIITDFEAQVNGEWMDCNPYLSEPFKKWLEKGYQIDMLIEPYSEGGDAKKRFYVFFTDTTNDASINGNLISLVNKYIEDGTCSLVTFNAKNYGIDCNNKENSCSSDISMRKIELDEQNHQLYVIDDSWEDIKENVMKLDSHDEAIVGEDSVPVPLIDNLKIKDGTTYEINNIKLVATNISKQYISKQDSTLEIDNKQEIWNISDAFDIKITSDKTIEVYLNKKIFEEKHLYSDDEGFSGNLIRLDFEVSENGYSIKPYDSEVMEWISARKNTRGKNANCVSLSIENAVTDKSVAPSAPQNKLLYTIFIQTKSY